MSQLRLRIIPLLAALSFGAGAAETEDYDDRFYVTPMASYVFADDDRNTEDGWGATLAFGKRIAPRLELELRAAYLKYDADPPQLTPAEQLSCSLAGNCPSAEDVEVKTGGAGFNVFASPSGRGLYLHADAMAGDSTVWNLGAGLALGGDSGWGLRLEALYHDDDGDFRETQLNLGLHIPIGRRAAPPPVIEEVAQVVPVEPPPPAPCEMPQSGQPMTLEGCATGDTLVLRGVNFDFDQDTLTAEAKILLDEVAAALLARPDISVEVRGHTDYIGSDAYNLDLSERRAQSVRTYLGGKGVGAERMTARGFGESVPVADNATDEGRERNRRAELGVIEGGSGAAAMPPAAPAANEAPATDCVVPAPGQQVDARGCAVGSAAPAAFSFEPAQSEPAAAPAPAPAAAAGSAAVRIGMMVFEPEELVIAPGTTVTWTNADGSNHNVAFADAKSGRMRENATWSRQFDAPGEYPYECSIHGPSMKGKIIVR